MDRTSVNLNFDAHIRGAEVEAAYEPLPGLRFNFSGGYENTQIAKGAKAIDLMDRTAGNSDWMVVKPFVTQSSNCIIPTSAVAQAINNGIFGGGIVDIFGGSACGNSYVLHEFGPNSRIGV